MWKITIEKDLYLVYHIHIGNTIVSYMKGDFHMNADKVKSKKEKLDPMVVKVAIILVIGSLAPLLDSTMVNVAIKSITVDFKSTVSVIQWVITGYVLAMGISIPISGWANNRFGGKRIFMFSLIAFLAGSVLSALSWNIGSMIVFRLFQGLGAGLMIPTTQNLLVQISGGKHLGQLISYVSIPAALGPILGPVLGGVIVNSLSWRWIFYVNVPVTLVAIFLAWRGLPKDKISDHKVSLDWIGISMLSPAFALLIYGIAQISTHGGIASSAVFVPLMIGVVLMIAFIVYALRRKGTPVLDLRLFRSRNFSASCILLFLSGIISNGAMLLLPLYYQQVRGESVLYAGLLLIPQGVGMLATRSWFGTLTDQIGSRLIVLVSLIVTVLGTLPFAFANANTNQILLGAALLIRGAGMGGILIPVMATAYVGLEKEHIPDASTATRILQTIGGAFGSAILATVIQHQLTIHQTMKAAQATVGAYNVAFWWSIGFTVISIIPAFLLPMYKKGAEIKAV
jgi:EmrB/QacA subfamily drug resistance transporter